MLRTNHYKTTRFITNEIGQLYISYDFRSSTTTKNLFSITRISVHCDKYFVLKKTLAHRTEHNNRTNVLLHTNSFKVNQPQYQFKFTNIALLYIHKNSIKNSEWYFYSSWSDYLHIYITPQNGKRWKMFFLDLNFY